MDPTEILAQESLDGIINLSASPWHYGKSKVRRELVADTARLCQCPVVYCNLIGGNDELIFDGRSLAANAQGEIIADLPVFEESLTVIDLDNAEPKESVSNHEMELIHNALVLGLRDYASKCGFKRALLGLSGGIDSAVVACIAAEALGSENILAISLPSSISSPHSKTDAQALAKNLAIEIKELPIQSIIDAAADTLAPLLESEQANDSDTTLENLHARSRGIVLMAISNKHNSLLLTTGNKSELAVGYCTLYGDMAGGLAVISDVPKTKVYELAKYINRDKEIIPENIINKRPSAELKPDQFDEDSLPPYPVLDEILCFYIEEGLSSKQIVEAGFDEATVNDIIRKVDLNEYKRKQAPPGFKITPLAFGVGRRIPIVQKYLS